MFAPFLLLGAYFTPLEFETTLKIRLTTKTITN
nr:MAG TPA: hypothetical protein [Caudoviricetes sp.]